MVSSAASTVDDYLTALPPDRRAAIARVRDVVNARLPRGYEETMQYGMISWIVPRSRVAETYNGQPLAVASLASQKQYMALYLMTIYGDTQLNAWFKAAYQATGKKLDMGKACVRFKTLDALPLEVIGEAVSRVPVDAYVAIYEAGRARPSRARPSRARPSRARPSRALRSSPATRAKPAARSSRAPRSSPATRAKPAARPSAVARAKPTARAKSAARTAKPTRAAQRR